VKRYLISLLVILSTSNITYALTSDDLLHPTAHIAGSYLITHVGEVVCKKITGLNKTVCSIISGSVATGIGVAIEMNQPKEANHKKSYIENASGVILAIGTIHIDF